MKVIQNRKSGRVGCGFIEDVIIPQGMEKVISVQLTETLHLNKLTKAMHNKVKRAIERGINDSWAGLSGKVYRTLCALHGLPVSHINAGNLNVYSSDRDALEMIIAKDLLLRNSRGSNAQGYYGRHGKASAHKVGLPQIRPNTNDNNSCINGYNCGIKRDEACEFIKESYYKDFGPAIAAALKDLENGEELVYKSTVGAE